MNKTLGYILSIAGLIIMAIGFGTFKLDWPILKTLTPSMITIIGVISIGVGVFILMKTGKKGPVQAQMEVPIYQGNKIIGYRRG